MAKRLFRRAKRSMPVRLPIAVAIFAVSLLVPGPAAADPGEALARPAGKVILTVTGKISRTNAPGRAEFDRAMIERLGQTTLRTTTPWTDGVPVFRGVLARNLLATVGADGEIARAIALNDYIYDIPASDFRKFPVLLALEKDGDRLALRNKGPIWIIYPLDKFDEFSNRAVQRKMVWQLTQLEIK